MKTSLLYVWIVKIPFDKHWDTIQYFSNTFEFINIRSTERKSCALNHFDKMVPWNRLHVIAQICYIKTSHNIWQIATMIYVPLSNIVALRIWIRENMSSNIRWIKECKYLKYEGRNVHLYYLLCLMWSY